MDATRRNALSEQLDTVYESLVLDHKQQEFVDLLDRLIRNRADETMWPVVRRFVKGNR